MKTTTHGLHDFQTTKEKKKIGGGGGGSICQMARLELFCRGLCDGRCFSKAIFQVSLGWLVLPLRMDSALNRMPSR